ncbi:MAG TPA: proton-conducting transporter membrane subunit [Streptosporangiaceae bacterium]|nr:proton-conducting transporter membrane subunit [Streptosporangiaceae bacterium]
MSTALLGSLLPLAVVIPIGGAVVAPLLARLSTRLPVLVSAASLAGTAAVLLLMAPRVFGGQTISHYMGLWTPVQGRALGVAFAAEPFGLCYALTCAVVGALLLIYTLSEQGGLGPRELGGYACLFQLLLAALIGVGLTADLFNLFVWFEVAAIASFGLTGFFLERPIALEAAFKIAILTTMAGFIVFVGIGLLYAEHGALNFGQLSTALRGRTTTADLIALGLLVAGLATKAGLIPLHGWLADAHEAAPGPVSALFSGLMVAMGVVAMARLAFQVYPPGRTAVLGLLMVAGVISALAGAVLALAQDDLKRLLAYDTVSQMGLVVVGFATGVAPGIAGATYHIVNHALFKGLLFLCASAIIHRTGMTRLSEMGGLARTMPIVTAAFVVAVGSIAGVPGLGGYVSVSLIHEPLLKEGRLGLVAALLAAQVITVAALGRAAWLAFFRPRAEAYGEMERLHPGMVTGFAALSACCVASGVAPRFALDHVLGPAAGSLLRPARYAAAVLSGSGTTQPPPIPFPLPGADPVAHPRLLHRPRRAGGGLVHARSRTAAGAAVARRAQRIGQRLCRVRGRRHADRDHRARRRLTPAVFGSVDARTRDSPGFNGVKRTCAVLPVPPVPIAAARPRPHPAPAGRPPARPAITTTVKRMRRPRPVRGRAISRPPAARFVASVSTARIHLNSPPRVRVSV